MGFFFADSGPVKGSGRTVNIDTLHRLECKACPLNRADVLSPKMEPSGAKNPFAYMLGEAPGEREDEEDEQFIGKSGKILRNVIPKKWRKKIRYNNCIRTHPPKNRDPTWQEIECCRPSIVRDIEATKPKAIFAIGKFALNWALNLQGDPGKITVWRGRRIPVKIGEHSCWLYPLMHPAAFMRKRKYTRTNRLIKSDDEKFFEVDLARALVELEYLDPPEIVNPKEAMRNIRTVTGKGGKADLAKIKRWLDEMATAGLVAIDIETASAERARNRKVRPYGKNARILSVAVSDGSKTYAFPIHHPGAGWVGDQKYLVEDLVEDFLLNAPCTKVAHKLDFELEWFAYFYSYKILSAQPWGDTMAQAFVLDGRAGALNLDALCRIHFGFPIKSFSNLDISNLDKEPLADVLDYNGLDAKATAWLFFSQQTLIADQRLEKVYQDQVRRIPTSVLTQLIGLDVDQKEVRRQQEKFQFILDEIMEEIKGDDALIRFKEKIGHRFNPSSTKDVVTMFGSVLQYDEVRDRNSADKHILAKLDDRLAHLIMEHREGEKMKSTYIDGLSEDGGKSLWRDKKLHPTYKTCFVATRRTSSEDPSAQTFPKKKNREVRGQIHASKGHKFVSFDYGAAEFRVIGMASKDKSLVDAIWDRYDVHMEWAEKLVHAYPARIGGKKFIKDKDVMKEFREEAKNKFVFPTCYGAVVPSIAEDLEIPENYVGPVWDEFWDTFPGVLKWQEDTFSFYEDCGYVELLTGFRRYGPLSRNQTINTPIQGTQSEIVVEAWNNLSDVAQKGQLQYQACLNIHDDLSFVLPDKTLDDDIEFIIKEMLDIKYSFINVPLLVEVAVGSNWFDLKPIGDYYADDFGYI